MGNTFIVPAVHPDPVVLQHNGGVNPHVKVRPHTTGHKTSFGCSEDPMTIKNNGCLISLLFCQGISVKCSSVGLPADVPSVTNSKLLNNTAARLSQPTNSFTPAKSEKQARPWLMMMMLWRGGRGYGWLPGCCCVFDKWITLNT